MKDVENYPSGKHKGDDNSSSREMQIQEKDENYEEMEDRLNYFERCTFEIKKSQKQLMDVMVGLSKSLNYLESGIMKELQRISAGYCDGCAIHYRAENAEWKVSRKSKIGYDFTMLKKI